MITRRRKRPRIRSCSFRTLGWLIRREATYQVCIRELPGELLPFSRFRWAELTTETATGLARRELRVAPSKRYYP